jgi:CheY-like chemotaxis protein
MLEIRDEFPDSSTHKRLKRGRIRVEIARVTKQKLLLIDHSWIHTAATRLFLRETDLEIYTAQSGEDGIAQADAARPDLILLDVQMPGIDGFETCRRIRTQSWGTHVPIVIASADIGARERDMGRAAGCTDFFQKPFDKQGLLALVQRYLDDGDSA